MVLGAILEQVQEYMLVTQFGGGAPCPAVQTLARVDVDTLTAGDNDPLFVTLQISEVGRVSKNGVIYDEYLVSEIESALREGGIQGLMGHLPMGELDSAFPHSDTSSTPLAGFWVGVMRVGEILWGKAYIPPGKVREYIRRLKATGGKLGVSFFGKAIVEELDGGTRRLRDFVLETLDFAPPTRASLELAGSFDVTSEFENRQDDEEGDMPEPITLNDVPQQLIQEIERRALEREQATENAQRVQELEQQVTTQETQLAEMRQHAHVVTEISAFLPDDADIVAVVREMNETVTRLTEILGDGVNIVTRIEEYHRNVQEMEQERFESAVSDQVTELTNWQVAGETNTNRLNTLRQNFQAQIVAQMNDDRNVNRVQEVAQAVWDNGFQVVAEAVRDAMAGPSAFVGGQQSANDFKSQVKTEDGRKNLKAKFGIK